MLCISYNVMISIIDVSALMEVLGGKKVIQKLTLFCILLLYLVYPFKYWIRKDISLTLNALNNTDNSDLENHKL